MGVSVALIISLLCCVETVVGHDNSTQPQNNGSLAAWPFDWGPNRTVIGHDNSTQHQNSGSLSAWLFDCLGYFGWGPNRTVIGHDNLIQPQNNGMVSACPHPYHIHMEDCTNTFENRIIRLEYLYWKSYWLSDYLLHWDGGAKLVYSERRNIFDHRQSFSWKLVNCGDNYVCFESMRNPSYVLAAYHDWKKVGLEHLSDIKRDATYRHKFYIKCNSCQTRSKCWIYNSDNSRLYASYNTVLTYNTIYTTCAGGNYLEYDWEIVLLLPMERWNANVRKVCNRGPEDIGVHFNEKYTVGVSKKTIETHGLSFEMSAALPSTPVSWAYTGKITQTNEWTNEEQYQAEHATEITIRGADGTNGISVPPNKAAVLKQLIGYYGTAGSFDTTFYSSGLYFKVEVEDC